MREAPAVGRPLRGTIAVPGDKAIAHRAAIVAALASGRSRLAGFPPAGDPLATLRCLRALGVMVETTVDGVGIEGGGPKAPGGALDCGRSATTMRLLAGALAGRPFRATLTGDPQLLARPMDRVAGPLAALGADVRTAAGGRPPIRIRGRDLRGATVHMDVPSAQVKSAILLAGMSAAGTTTVVEPLPTRDHTERLLTWLGAPIRRDIHGLTVAPFDPPPFELRIPGDPSSAAFLLAAAAILPGSDVRICDVGVNPTRLGFIRTLSRMGAPAEVHVEAGAGPEPAGTIRVRHTPLRAITVGREDAAGAIDELPLLALVATQAEGVTAIRGAAELRVKESDRIAGLTAGLRALGAKIEEARDGVTITGPTPLRGAAVDAMGDHRLAMTFAVAGLVADGRVEVQGIDRAADSFPGFLDAVRSLT